MLSLYHKALQRTSDYLKGCEARPMICFEIASSITGEKKRCLISCSYLTGARNNKLNKG